MKERSIHGSKNGISRFADCTTKKVQTLRGLYILICQLLDCFDILYIKAHKRPRGDQQGLKGLLPVFVLGHNPAQVLNRAQSVKSGLRHLLSLLAATIKTRAPEGSGVGSILFPVEHRVPSLVPGV